MHETNPTYPMNLNRSRLGRPRLPDGVSGPARQAPPTWPSPQQAEHDVLLDEIIEPVPFHFDLSRREFVSTLGAGLLITVMGRTVVAQRSGREGRSRGGSRGRGSAPVRVSARVHIGNDGQITVMTGKVEAGQGARAELTQAAAEELRVPAERVQLVMADTALVPNDGITAGSRSTPSTVPAIREGCAAARNLLVQLAAEQWKVDRGAVEVKDGKVLHAATNRQLGYGDLASAGENAKAFEQRVPSDVTVTAVAEWKVMGASVPRPDARDLVTGRHQYPSDIRRPGMLYGKILRPPAYESKLTAIDLAPAKAMPGAIVVRDGDFVGVVAPTSFAAGKAIEALEKTAGWESSPHPSSAELYDHLRRNANVPANPFKDELANAAKKLRRTYHAAYIQHAPLEPRVAVAEWNDGKLTVWTATQNPFGVRSELARAFRIDEDGVRVIVPDFGAGFGGKHTGETAVEAARLAKEAKKPVSLRWTRAEEFTWASFRPAAVMDLEASLDAEGKLTSWYHVNINAGGSAVNTPYDVAKDKCESISTQPPLRHGSYRALASTANNFARESFMDELAAAADRDPLEFRLAHLTEPRLRAVLESAAEKFNWKHRVKRQDPHVGVGLACGTEKGSYVAACAEIAIDAESAIHVRHVCQAYECGAIINPDNLLSQVRGCIIMGIGPALREAMEFENGRILNASFRKYDVPRFADVPQLDIHLLNRPDLPPVGAGETPIIVTAPAIANALFRATGKRLRDMPLRA